MIGPYSGKVQSSVFIQAYIVQSNLPWATTGVNNHLPFKMKKIIGMDGFLQ